MSENGNGDRGRWAWLLRLILPGLLGFSITLGGAALVWAGTTSERVTRNVERIAATLKLIEDRDALRQRELDQQRDETKAFRTENREDHAEIKRAVEALRRP